MTIFVGEPKARMEYELWQAIVELESGDRRGALQRASRVVADAQAEGHVRLFLDAGPPAERLLRVLERDSPSSYVRHLVSVASEVRDASDGDDARLSGRELEVVRYLPTSLSSDEIASQLYISLNTLKTHLRRIYRKLGVSGRRDAAMRAEALGIA